MSDFRIKLVDIVTEGFKPERAEHVRSELSSVLRFLPGHNFDLIQDVMLTIIVTDKMAHHVDRVRAEHGVDFAPYSQMRNSVMAVGITLAAPVESPAHVTTIFDNGAWLTDVDDQMVTRIYLLGHELGHVIQTGRRTLAERSPWERQVRTYSLSLEEAAANYRDEFDADTTADSICKLSLRSKAGEPIHPADLIGAPFIDAAHDLCEQFCRFAGVDVQTYRITSIGLDDLHPKALVLLGELMMVLAHATALYAGAEKFDFLTSELEKSPGFRAYISKDWNNFTRGLSDDDPQIGQQTLIKFCESVLARAGLKIEDMADGLYVHVHEPEFCDDADDTAPAS